MRTSRFPDPRLYGDITAVGGVLSLDYLIDAYSNGIFPWPMSDTDELPWFCPERRALWFFDEIHRSRSLMKTARKAQLRFTIDEAFLQVIEHCAETPRPGQDGTWITREMIDAYTDFHRQGYAHSIEAWQGDELVGGIYGVDCGGVFAAESMFYKMPSASKLALLFLADYLKEKGSKWIDIQALTPHMEKLGAREINRDEFLRLLRLEQDRNLRLFSAKT